MGGTSIRWLPLSLKFLTHSLTLDYHDLNLGEGSLVLVGEIKGISGLDTKILMRFQYALVETKFASKPMGIVGLSFILILKLCLKMR